MNFEHSFEMDFLTEIDSAGGGARAAGHRRPQSQRDKLLRNPSAEASR